VLLVQCSSCINGPFNSKDYLFYIFMNSDELCYEINIAHLLTIHNLKLVQSIVCLAGPPILVL